MKKIRNCIISVMLILTFTIFGISHPCEVKANPLVAGYTIGVAEAIASLLMLAGVSGLKNGDTEHYANCMVTAYKGIRTVPFGVVQGNVLNLTSDFINFVEGNVKCFQIAGDIGCNVDPKSVYPMSVEVPYGQLNISSYKFTGYGIYQVTTKNGLSPYPQFYVNTPSWTCPAYAYLSGDNTTKPVSATNGYFNKNNGYGLTYSNNTFYIYVYPSGFQTNKDSYYAGYPFANTIDRFSVKVMNSIRNMAYNGYGGYGFRDSNDDYDSSYGTPPINLISNHDGGCVFSLMDNSNFDILKVYDYGFDDFSCTNLYINNYDNTKISNVTSVKVSTDATDTDLSNVVSGATTIPVDSAGTIDLTGTGTGTQTGDYTGILNNIWTGIQTGATDIVNAISTALSGVSTGVSSIASAISGFFTDTTDINTDSLNVDVDLVTKKFPFSGPWDVSYLLGLFCADPVAPKFTLDIWHNKAQPVVVDLSIYNDLMAVVRQFEFIGFVCLFVWKSRGLMNTEGGD